MPLFYNAYYYDETLKVLYEYYIDNDVILDEKIPKMFIDLRLKSLKDSNAIKLSRCYEVIQGSERNQGFILTYNYYIESGNIHYLKTKAFINDEESTSVFCEYSEAFKSYDERIAIMNSCAHKNVFPIRILEELSEKVRVR